MIIYKITNKINGKIYIGQTRQSIDIRFSCHCKKSTATKGVSLIANSIQKYGRDNFTIIKIDEAYSLPELNEKETYWINFYNSTNKTIGYNLMSGGRNSSHSQESKDKISKANSNPSPETRKRKSDSHKGKPAHKNSIAALVRATKGIPQSDEHKQKRSLALKGKPRSEETRRKISESHLKRKLSN